MSKGLYDQMQDSELNYEKYNKFTLEMITEFALELSTAKVVDEKRRKFNSSLDKVSFMHEYKDTHIFSLAYQTNYHTLVTNNHPRELIRLDKEDIKYFKNKYLPKINDEFQAELEKLKKKYDHE